ncbi:uncharacterized protein MCAP_0864-like [Chironomus tepperi]|uniref:uncharacterized protein MCAP_0864-like n=1 Tax=Chironomus tepperi TaxID=113505 RepID=UPI00391FC349
MAANRRSDDLSCYFMTHSDGYNCHVRGRFEQNTTITSINGVHNKLKNDSDVEVLFMERTSLSKYLPFGVCTFFDSLTELECFGSQLIELTREVFVGCSKLDLVMIQNSKFTSLPTDVFYDLATLRTLEISSTKLSVLQAGLFEKNQNLLKLELQNNQLAIINVEFPPSVIQIDLTNNLCIDSNFTKPADEIYRKCSNESVKIIDLTTEDLSIRSLIDKLNASVISNELEIKKLINLTLDKSQSDNNDIIMRLDENQISLENIQNSSLREQQDVNDKVYSELTKINRDLVDERTEQLECDYIKHSDGYNCEMKSVYEENKEITSVIGEHKFGKNDTDVEVFFITDSSKTKYVPTKICGVLRNITKFDIYGTSLVEIKQDVFGECFDLKKIVIKYIKLKTLEEDLFEQVENLENFVLGFTHVEVLPQKLFAKNQKLKFLDLSFNKLKQITTEFPSTLTMLSLMNNECIDGHYDSRSLSSTTTMNKLIMDTYKKCRPNGTVNNTNFTSYDTIRINIVEEQINDNEKKLSALETIIENLEVKLTNKIDENLRTLKAFKLDTTDTIDKIKKEVTGLEKASKDHSEKFLKVTNQLQSDSRDIKLKLEKNNELKKMSAELREEINRNENLLVTLFCFQLVMIAAAIFFGVYRNCYSNRGHGARLVNDQTNPNFQ